MFGSKSNFFNQDSITLIKKRKQVEFLLKDVWERPEAVVVFYLQAYDYFILNPNDFDGATIVKDLNAITGLDIHAMIHDYIYVTYNVSSDIVNKYRADLIYSFEMERMGGSAYSTWSRFIGLTTFGFFFYLYRKVSGVKMTSNMKTEFDNIWKIFK